jgi:pimeloyl-ACP methyl ester carboxylesterase
MRVPSSDGVEVALHDFGGDGPPLLLSHATGFHGWAYRPIADALASRFHSFARDYRGHGDTAAPHDWQVDWTRYGDDALAAARAAAPGGGLVGFGHSMGGAGLLMAAHRDPGLFDLVVAFEPIVFPPVGPDGEAIGERVESPLVAGARRRRRSFPSVEAAIDNYASKPPMMAFEPAALRAYVEHGVRPTGEGVTLKCDPEHEARTFEQGALHRTWDLLPDIATRVVVVAGVVEEMGPASVSARIAEALPNATYLELAHLDHFGPFTHPREVADLVAAAADAR